MYSEIRASELAPKIRVFTTGHCIYEKLQIEKKVIEIVLLLEDKMDIQRIEEIAQAEMAGLRCDSREPGWILYHGQRTGKLTCCLQGSSNVRLIATLYTSQGYFTILVMAMIYIMKWEQI